jgi:hypothetical protein
MEQSSSPAKLAANRSNALRSTGPRTSAGKTRSSKNALRHGVYSVLPVVPGLEESEDWATHRAGILKSLAPEGTLEESLAERVALCLWRLNRVHRYETAITTVGLEHIEEQLRPRKPAVKLDFPGLEVDEVDEAYGWHGWTAGMVRQGAAKLSESIGIAPERLLAKALRKRRDIQDQNTEAVQKLEATVKVLRRRLKAKEDRLTRERMLPDVNTLQKITRYEAHLSRQLLQALHELQRLQAARGGQAVPLPAALDVVVDGASGEDMSEVFDAAQSRADE